MATVVSNPTAHWRTSAACAFFTLAAWWVMASRAATDVQVGDGADFAAAAATGGLAHPPGFPIYTTLGTWLTRVSEGTPYAVLAQTNAVLQSVAVGLLCLLCTLLSGRLALGLAVSAAWGLFPASLRAGTDVEVFALHHVLVLALVGLGWFHQRNPSRLAGFAVGVAWGLAGAHQPIAIIWAPFVCVVIAQRPWRVALPVLLAFASGLFLGLAPYLLLWGRYAASPLTAFEDITSWGTWFAYVMREHYGTLHLGAQSKAMQNGGGAIAWDALRWMPGVVIAALAALRGVFNACRQRTWDVHGALLLAMLAHGAFAMLLRIPAGPDHDVASRFAPSILLPAALCAAYVLGTVNARWRQLGTAVLCIPALLQLPLALQLADTRHDVRAAFVLDEALQEAPAGAVWFTGTDTTVFGSTYRQAGQNIRPDVQTIFVPRLGSPYYRRQLATRVPAVAHLSLDARRDVAQLAAAVHAAGQPIIADPVPIPKPFVRSPLGMVFQWSPNAAPLDDTRHALLAMCSRLPPELQELPRAREATQWLWNAGFSTPIAATFAQFATSETPLGRALQTAAKALQEQDFAGARATCAMALRS